MIWEYWNILSPRNHTRKIDDIHEDFELHQVFICLFIFHCVVTFLITRTENLHWRCNITSYKNIKYKCNNIKYKYCHKMILSGAVKKKKNVFRQVLNNGKDLQQSIKFVSSSPFILSAKSLNMISLFPRETDCIL